MTVLIIEDEPLAARRLKELIVSVNPETRVMGILDSVKSSVKWLQENDLPSLVFMDIQLADGLSFEIFEQIQVPAPIIFTTAYDEYALKAFKVNSIDYLLKPIDEDQLVRAMQKYKSLTGRQDSPQLMMQRINDAVHMLTRKYKERFVTKVGEHIRFVSVDGILFFFSQEKVTFCMTSEGRKHILDFSLDQLAELLDPSRFFRINRKYIVSVDAITDMISHTNSRVKLKLKASDDNDVIVARERVQEFKDWLDR